MSAFRRTAFAVAVIVANFTSIGPHTLCGAVALIITRHVFISCSVFSLCVIQGLGPAGHATRRVTGPHYHRNEALSADFPSAVLCGIASQSYQSRQRSVALTRCQGLTFRTPRTYGQPLSLSSTPVQSPEIRAIRLSIPRLAVRTGSGSPGDQFCNFAFLVAWCDFSLQASANICKGILQVLENT
jgi:hypothetical protein